MQYKLKHRLSAALMAGAMCCTMIPAASADEIATPETVDTAVPEVTDSVTPALSQITENLYNDLPDAPTGSYIGSMGLPVATGENQNQHFFVGVRLVRWCGCPHGCGCIERG